MRKSFNDFLTGSFSLDDTNHFLVATFGSTKVDITQRDHRQNQAKHFVLLHAHNDRLHFWCMVPPYGVVEHEVYPLGIEVARYVINNLEHLTGGKVRFGQNGLKPERGLYYNHCFNEFWLTPQTTDSEVSQLVKKPPYTGIEPRWALDPRQVKLAGPPFAFRQQEIVRHQP